eukprot:TRINITY_DN3339_c1_g1_i1.p1 TRINITY_DN3339_c1_g1~~TRINITY_DN3339_c1_g1_i1.p1  ORF type:complete len:775 (+),score=229.17 TRINITY_DN3339_c1_g1_i1:144-2468(+)
MASGIRASACESTMVGQSKVVVKNTFIELHVDSSNSYLDEPSFTTTADRMQRRADRRADFKTCPEMERPGSPDKSEEEDGGSPSDGVSSDSEESVTSPGWQQQQQKQQQQQQGGAARRYPTLLKEGRQADKAGKAPKAAVKNTFINVPEEDEEDAVPMARRNRTCPVTFQKTVSAGTQTGDCNLPGQTGEAFEVAQSALYGAKHSRGRARVRESRGEQGPAVAKHVSFKYMDSTRSDRSDMTVTRSNRTRYYNTEDLREGLLLQQDQQTVGQLQAQGMPLQQLYARPAHPSESDDEEYAEAQQGRDMRMRAFDTMDMREQLEYETADAARRQVFCGSAEQGGRDMRMRAFDTMDMREQLEYETADASRRQVPLAAAEPASPASRQEQLHQLGNSNLVQPQASNGSRAAKRAQGKARRQSGADRAMQSPLASWGVTSQGFRLEASLPSSPVSPASTQASASAAAVRPPVPGTWYEAAQLSTPLMSSPALPMPYAPQPANTAYWQQLQMSQYMPMQSPPGWMYGMPGMSATAMSMPPPPALPAPLPLVPPPLSPPMTALAAGPTSPTSSPVALSGVGGFSLPLPLPPGIEATPLATLARAGGEAARPANKRPLRLWAHIYLHMQAPGFDLVPMLIGRGGQNMRKIAEATGAKLRVRGKGSGHLEIEGKREAPTPLMLAVTTEKKDGLPAFKAALERSFHELRIVEKRYKLHCQKEGIQCEPPAFSVGLLTDGIQDLLGDTLVGIPMGAFTTKDGSPIAAQSPVSALPVGPIPAQLQ